MPELVSVDAKNIEMLTRKESGLKDPKQKAASYETAETLCETLTDCDDT